MRKLELTTDQIRAIVSEWFKKSDNSGFDTSDLQTCMDDLDIQRQTLADFKNHLVIRSDTFPRIIKFVEDYTKESRMRDQIKSYLYNLDLKKRNVAKSFICQNIFLTKSTLNKWLAGSYQTTTQKLINLEYCWESLDLETDWNQIPEPVMSADDPAPDESICISHTNLVEVIDFDPELEDFILPINFSPLFEAARKQGLQDYQSMQDRNNSLQKSNENLLDQIKVMQNEIKTLQKQVTNLGMMFLGSDLETTKIEVVEAHDISDVKKISMWVRGYAKDKGQDFNECWNNLYTKFQYTSGGFNPRQRKESKYKDQNVTLLKVIELEDKLPLLFAIAKRYFKTV